MEIDLHDWCFRPIKFWIPSTIPHGPSQQICENQKKIYLQFTFLPYYIIWNTTSMLCCSWKDAMHNFNVVFKNSDKVIIHPKYFTTRWITRLPVPLHPSPHYNTFSLHTHNSPHTSLIAPMPQSRLCTTQHTHTLTRHFRKPATCDWLCSGDYKREVECALQWRERRGERGK